MAKKPSKSNQAHDPARSEAGSESSLPYCQVFVHQDGVIQLSGDDHLVRALMERLEAAGFTIRWDYRSRCG